MIMISSIREEVSRTCNETWEHLSLLSGAPQPAVRSVPPTFPRTVYFPPGEQAPSRFREALEVLLQEPKEYREGSIR
jgi:hypothetical protein